MSSSAIKNELADHIYQYLCHEAQFSDLPEAARESLTAASECIEQAYKLNVNNKQQIESGAMCSINSTSTSILPDELLRIFTRHKEQSQHPISQLPMTTRKKLSHLRAQIKRQASKSAHRHHHHHQRQHEASATSSSGSHLIPADHHSVHQKNFKQKLIALIKKFRTDGSDFDSEEQYREALERELMKAAAGRGSRAIEELLEEEIDVEGESGSETDNISESSTPKPSLRPFFSSTTLDKI